MKIMFFGGGGFKEGCFLISARAKASELCVPQSWDVRSGDGGSLLVLLSPTPQKGEKARGREKWTFLSHQAPPESVLGHTGGISARGNPSSMVCLPLSVHAPRKEHVIYREKTGFFRAM